MLEIRFYMMQNLSHLCTINIPSFISFVQNSLIKFICYKTFIVEICKQGLFEGTKAYRKENGKLLLFRPEENAIRMMIGAERMCMIPPSIDQFVDALKRTALANKRWVSKRISIL